MPTFVRISRGKLTNLTYQFLRQYFLELVSPFLYVRIRSQKAPMDVYQIERLVKLQKHIEIYRAGESDEYIYNRRVCTCHAVRVEQIATFNVCSKSINIFNNNGDARTFLIEGCRKTHLVHQKPNGDIKIIFILLSIC